MFVVDTNILLYAANRNALEHKICRKFILKCRKQVSPWYLTWGIVYEFLRVATHPRVFLKPWSIGNAWDFIQSLHASPSLSMLTETERHLEVAAEVFNAIPLLSGNLVFYGRTAILMKEHGIKRIYTRDTDFHHFAFLEVINPLQS